MDKWWRIENLYVIKNKDGDLQIFKLNEVQKRYVRERGQHGRNYIVKARQQGFTTLHCIEMLDEAMHISGTGACIIAHERGAVTDIFKIVKLAYKYFPNQFKPAAKYDSKNEYYFESSPFGFALDSRIYVAMRARSGTNTILHISESARIRDRQELNSGSKQAVGISGRITEETTGNGYNAFYDEVNLMKSDWNKKTGVPQKLKYKVHFFPWQEHKEYRLNISELPNKKNNEKEIQNKFDLSDGQLAWRRMKIKELGDTMVSTLTPEQLFKQEYPMTFNEAFQASGNTYFDTERVDQIQLKKPIATDTNGIVYWYEPEDNHNYVVGGDPSTGRGLDYTSINVWDVTDLKQVAQFHGYVDPIEGAGIMQSLSEKYNNALAAPENNMLTMALTLSKNYHNTYREVKIDKITQKRTKVIGFSTTSKTRPVMMDNFRRMFEDGDIEINSPITKSEMMTFIIKDNGRVEAIEGKHDDSLFADMIALQVRTYGQSGLLNYYKSNINAEKKETLTGQNMAQLFREARRQRNF